MRVLTAACFALLLCFLALSAPAEAAPGTGRLAFASTPVLEGTLEAEGGGEVVARSADTEVRGSGPRIEVTEVWHETTAIGNPIGGSFRSDTSEVQYRTENFSDATLRLTESGEDFELLLFTGDEGRLHLPPVAVAFFSIEAYANPRLIVDDSGAEDQVRDDDRVFTWASPGDRFPVEASLFEATGAHTVYIGGASFEVTSDGETHTFHSGSETTRESPTTSRERTSYYLVHLPEGTTQVSGGDAACWFAAPTFQLDGTLSSARASGEIEMAGSEHLLEADAVTVGGLLTLTPEPFGEAEPKKERADVHVGTSTPSDGVYSGTSSEFDGEVTVLAIGAEVPFAANEEFAVAATVGVLTLAGAVLLLTPQGKWAVLTLITPFYAKTERNRLLDNESRDRIFQAIRNNPGINLSQIHRLADLGWGVTVYHLKMMEKNGLVFAESNARDKCFFENDPKFRRLRSAIASIANREPAQRVVEVVVALPGITQSDVVESTGLTQRSVSYYLGSLARKGLLQTERDGSFVRYRATEPLVEALRLVSPAGEQLGAVAAAPVPSTPVEA